MQKNISLLSFVFAVIRRDMLVSLRKRSELANPILFFIIVIALFPLGLGPDSNQLAMLAPGVLWVTALLASMLSADALFRSDYDDATLETLLLSPGSLYFASLGKIIAHWLLTGLPLVLVSPLLATMLQLPSHGIPVLMASLALGTACLSFVGAIGSALTVGLRKGGLLLALLVLPLYVPVLIFGSSAVQSAVEGADYLGQLAVLGGFLLVALALAPAAIAGGLRISVDQ